MGVKIYNQSFNLTKPLTSVFILKYSLIFFVCLLTVSASSCVSRPISPTSTNETVFNTPSASSAPSENTTAANTSTNETSSIPETNNDILQIFSNGKLISSGVAIGDGSYVITVLDYLHNEYLPDGSFNVVTSKGEKFSASIQVLDPRTSATLLKLQNGKIAPVKLINSSEIYEGQQIILWGWSQPELVKFSASAGEPGGSPPRFDFGVPQEQWMQWTRLNYALLEQSIVTDTEGNVLGIKGVYFNLYPIWGDFKGPTVLAAENFLNLLSSDVMQQSWINGPVSFYLGDKSFSGASFTTETPSTYAFYTSALNQSFTKIGNPLTPEVAQNTFLATSDRRALTAIYASPINLMNSAGDVLARARWIMIEWGTTEEPAYLIYGDIYADVIGGFQLEGDISGLMRSHGI